MTIRLDSIRPGDGPLPRYAHACAICGRTFLGRRGALYCSDSCKSRAWQIEREKQAEK